MTQLHQKRFLALLFFISVVLALLLFYGPLAGKTFLPIETWASYFSESHSAESRAIFELRLFRTLTAFIAGASLAAGGLVFQNIFRNDLATPFTLGIVSGSAFGVAISIIFSSFIISLWGGAFLGALLDIAGILVIGSLYGSRAQSRFPAEAAMVLAGIVLSYFFAAGSMLARYIASPYDLSLLDSWLMGSFQLLEWKDLAFLFSGGSTLFLFLFLRASRLDILRFPDEWISARGISPQRERYFFLSAVMLAISLLVAYTGPVGFIGLIVPNAIRRMISGSSRSQLGLSILAGGALTIIIDICGRSGIFHASWPELPPGLLASFIGAPFFLMLLLKRS